MEELLTAALLGSTSLADLIDGRVGWNRLPVAEAVPAVILHQIPSSGADYTMGGRSRLTAYAVQVDCWAGTLAEALAVRRAVEAWAGPLTALRAPPLQVFVVRHHTGWDLAKGPDTARAADLYRASADLDVWFTDQS